MPKIAVVNRTNLKNYGSLLQSYALCKAVSDLGYDSEIIWEDGSVSENFDFRPGKLVKTFFKLLFHPSLIISTLSGISELRSKPVSEEKVKLFDEFCEKNVPRKFYSKQVFETLGEKDVYSKFICGSDQVWCSTTLYVDPLMYLRFAPEKKRIAYAPSIGRDFIPNYNKKIMKKYISEIPFVSTREKDAKVLIKNLIGRDVPVLLDPTLLIDKSHWRELSNKEIKAERKFILCYFLDYPTEKTVKEINRFSVENGFDIISIGVDLHGIDEKVNYIYPPCGPGEFLSYVDNAECVITDSYHGMLFAMNYEKKFWSVKREYGQYDQSSRQLTILENVNLTKRYCDGEFQFDNSDIDYIPVNEKLSEMRKKSVEFLSFAIKADNG